MSAIAMGVPATTVRRRPALYLVPATAPRVPVSSIPVSSKPVSSIPARSSSAVAAPVAWAARPVAPVRSNGSVAQRPALRLTQRGRLVRTLFVFAVAALLLSVAVARATTPDPLVADHATTVRPGQTLSEIAQAELPHLRVDDAVARLRTLNGLAGPTLVAGQSLLIPAL